MADELLDQVDKNDEIIGTVWKSKAHRNLEIIHREIGLILFNDKGETLLQQRSLYKKNDPGVWKVACAGHVAAGESPKDAVIRELFEELGIRANPIYYDKFFNKHNKKGQNKESRFVWTFYAVVKGRPKMKLDPKEVSDAKWVKIEDLEKFAKNNNFDISGFSYKITKEIYKKL